MRFRHKNFCVFFCLLVFCFQDGVFCVAGDDDIFSLLGVGKDAGKNGWSTRILDLVAVAGKLLKYKLPDDVFMDKTSSYEVTDATTHKNPSWLYIDVDSYFLYALPSPFEQGISTLQISSDGDVIAQFNVTVYPHQDRPTSSTFVPPAIKEQLEPYNENSLCNDNTNRIRSTVIFDQDFEKLSLKEKVSLIGRMSDFLSLDERLISLSSWKGYGMNHPDTSVLVAGPGNIIGQSKYNGLEMTWHVACGEFRQLNDFTKILEHNILGGRISSESGYPVIGWQVLTVGERRHVRLKRAAVSTPVLTSSLPTASILTTSTKTAALTSAVLESSTVVITSSASIETTQMTSQMSSTVSSATSLSASSSSVIPDSSTSIKSSESLPATSKVSQQTPSLSPRSSFVISPTPSSIFSSSTPVAPTGEVLQSSSMPPEISSVTPSASDTSAFTTQVPSLTFSLIDSPILTNVPSSFGSSLILTNVPSSFGSSLILTNVPSSFGSSLILTNVPSSFGSSLILTNVPSSFGSSAFILSTSSISMTTNISATTSVEMTSTPSFSLGPSSTDISSSASLTATPSMLDSSFTYSSGGSIQVSPTPTVIQTSGVVLPTTKQSSFVVSISTLDSSIPSMALTPTAATSSDVVVPTPSAIQNQTASLPSIVITSTPKTSATFQSTPGTFQSTSATFQSTSATFQSTSAIIEPTSAFNLTSKPFIPTSLLSSAFESTPHQTQVSTHLTSPSFSSEDVSSMSPTHTESSTLVTPLSTIEPTASLNQTYFTSPIIPTVSTSSADFTSMMSVSASPSYKVTPSFIESTTISVQPSSDLNSTVSVFQTSSTPFASSIFPTPWPTSTSPVTLTSTPSFDSSRITIIPSPTFSFVDSTIGPSVSATMSGNITDIPSTFPISSTEVSETISSLSTSESMTQSPTVSSSATASLSTSTSEVLETTSPTISVGSIDSVTVSPTVIYSTNIYPTSEILKTVTVTLPTSSFESVTPTSTNSPSPSTVPSMTTEFSTVQMSTTPSVESSRMSQTLTTVPTSLVTSSVDTLSYTAVPTERYTTVPTQSSAMTSGSPSIFESRTYLSTPTMVVTPSPSWNFSDILSSTFGSTTIDIQPTTSSSSASRLFTIVPTSKELSSLDSSMEPSSKFSVSLTSGSQTDTLSTTGIPSTPSLTQSVIPPSTLESSPVMSSTPVVTPTPSSSTFVETSILTSVSSSVDVSSTHVLSPTSPLVETAIFTMIPSITESIVPQTSVKPSSTLSYTSTAVQTSIISTGIISTSSLTVEPTVTSDTISIITSVTETVLTTPVFPSVTTLFSTVPSGLLTSSTVPQTSSVPVASSPTLSIETSASSSADLTSPIATTSVISEPQTPASTLVVTTSYFTSTLSSTIIKPESSSSMTSIAMSTVDSSVISSLSTILVTSSSVTPTPEISTTPEVSSTPAPSTTASESTLVSTTISPSSTAVVPSSSVVVTTATPTPPVPSEPPVLVKPIDTLDVPFKRFFQVRIPADMFKDPMEGTTRALSLSLLDRNNVSLKPDSWVQFNQTLQTIEGIALNAAVLVSPQQFVLRAENSAGRFVTDAFVLTVNQSRANINRNHLFSVTYDIQYDTFISSVPNIITLLNRIGAFLSDGSSEKLQIDAIRSGSVIIDWSNETLPQNTCDNTTIQDLFARLSNNNGTPKPEFVRAMGTEYPVTNVGLTLTGSCKPAPTISPTTAVPSSSVVVTTATPTSPVRPKPPVLVKPITTLDVPFKKYFQIQIPADTFQDPLEGTTRNLSLSLLDGNNKTLKPDSWVQFNRTLQTIEGIALDAALAESPQQFVLRAENSANLVVTDAFVITVNRTLANVQRNHLFSATYDLQYDTFTSSVTNITMLLNRIGVFFSDVTSEKIQIDAIRAGSVIIDWRNDTLPPNTCNNTTINELFSRLSYNNGTPKLEFVAAMGTEYPVTNVGVNFTGQCAPFVLPLVYDGTVYIAILVPIIIVLILIIAIIIYCICNRRQKRLSGRFLIDEDSTVDRNDRKPMYMPADLEMSDFHGAPKKPRKPLMFDNEGAENYPSGDAPYEPPVDRPEPPNYLLSMDPSLRYVRSSPPPSYHSDTSDPPPTYRLPPPYKNHSNT